MHHHRLWQVEILQLPQEEHPLLGFLCDGFPFKVLGDDGSQETAGLHNVDCGATHRVMGVSGAGFFLKSATISTVFTALSSRLFWVHQAAMWSISHL